uniref:CPG4 domain-containing protein n=1 Tax=Parastrongyloides trichosuri TaxID=131310 RepID=A0A0N5A356_PARTI
MLSNLIIKSINILLIFCFLITEIFCVVEKYPQNECPQSAFIGCILQLKLSGVTFDRNIANIIYSIDSEAKLLRTCKAYSNIMPCFREKISQCGSQKQRRMLNGVGKTIQFMCSPFSLKSQRILLSKGSCIKNVINKPISDKCEIKEPKLKESLSSCAKNCENQKGNVFCYMRTWITTQNLCTTLEIHKTCGTDAASFYSDFQSVAFEPTFPIVCQASIENIVDVKDYLKSDMKQSSIEYINNVFPLTNKNNNSPTSNIIKQTPIVKEYNDLNIRNIFSQALNENIIKNADNSKQTNLILQKIFPEKITKSYRKIYDTTPIPVIKKQQPNIIHFDRISNIYSNIRSTTLKPYTNLNRMNEKEHILLTTPYYNGENNKVIDDSRKKGTITMNEIELLASIMSNIPINDALMRYRSSNHRDIPSHQPQTTTSKYNKEEENPFNFLISQNDNQNDYLMQNNTDNKENIETIISEEENSVEDYDSFDYQTSTYIVPITTTMKMELTTKATSKKVIDGKRIPWYLRGMKKHVFVNENDAFKNFSQR